MQTAWYCDWWANIMFYSTITFSAEATWAAVLHVHDSLFLYYYYCTVIYVGLLLYDGGYVIFANTFIMSIQTGTFKPNLSPLSTCLQNVVIKYTIL